MTSLYPAQSLSTEQTNQDLALSLGLWGSGGLFVHLFANALQQKKLVARPGVGVLCAGLGTAFGYWMNQIETKRVEELRQLRDDLVKRRLERSQQ
ncbi:hypothetical protein EDD86DRAFT_209038 [Gorgonomyces haynaldii]|nr:hypothetical protein EDD86DRAFT_209038 [Gorgonomyces haynaldii]